MIEGDLKVPWDNNFEMHFKDSSFCACGFFVKSWFLMHKVAAIAAHGKYTYVYIYSNVCWHVYTQPGSLLQAAWEGLQKIYDTINSRLYPAL